jgi:energy-coupling factor transporter ATP-binding protein EcfA2
MSLRVMKYNPGFATDEALKKTFVVRTHFLKWIIEILAGNTSETNQHVLVIGSRGSGKTTLVRRVAIEIREDPKLQEHWYPIVFSEESYAITSVGEFWLEALKHLADQTNDERWQKTVVLQELPSLLATITPEGDLIGSLTDIFIDVAGAGYGKEAVEILKTGEVQETLKSLIVGIQIYLGEQPIAAQEVLEIGKDVAQRIRDRKK